MNEEKIKAKDLKLLARMHTDFYEVHLPNILTEMITLLTNDGAGLKSEIMVDDGWDDSRPATRVYNISIKDGSKIAIVSLVASGDYELRATFGSDQLFFSTVQYSKLSSRFKKLWKKLEKFNRSIINSLNHKGRESNKAGALDRRLGAFIEN